MSASFTTALTVEEALAAAASGARPVAGGTDLVVGARQGKAALPDMILHQTKEIVNYHICSGIGKEKK